MTHATLPPPTIGLNPREPWLPRSVSGKFALFFVYLLVALPLWGGWSFKARTESPLYSNDASIPAIANANVEKPWVYRRLLAETARGLARLVPAKVWETASNRIDSKPALQRIFRQKMGWRRATDPIVMAGHVLVFLGIYAFMIAGLRFQFLFFVSPPALRYLTGIIFGFAVTGGYAIGSWHLYPYDAPQAALFLWGVICALRGNWIFFPLVALASYNKETSLLLPIVAALFWGRFAVSPRGRNERWIVAGVAILIYAGVQGWIHYRYRAWPAANVSLFGRNIQMTIQTLTFDNWTVPLEIVALAMFVRCWPRFPRTLRGLIFIPVVLLLAGAFRAWIEERRQYMEAVPILTLMWLQVVCIAIGKPEWMQVCPVEATAPPVTSLP